MKDTKQIVAENLTFLRKQKKLTQLELAEKLNYSDKSISKWEHGDTMPDIEVLQKIAELYGVTLDYIVSDAPASEKKNMHKQARNKQNQIIISLLGVVFVWLVAAVLFVYLNIILNENYWRVYIWALPISCIVLFYFNKIWGNKKFLFVIISIFIWSLLLALYLQFLTYNILLVFVVGIPAQVAVVLWSRLK